MISCELGIANSSAAILFTYISSDSYKCIEMEAKKPYVIAIIVQVIYTGMFIISKAAFDKGINTFVFIFYRQAASSLLLLPVAVFLES